jgi:kinetochore-associated protein 1
LQKLNQKLSEKVESLLAILAEVENKEFFLYIRGMDIPDRTLLARFLQFLLKSIDSLAYPDEFDEINENLLRLDTLKLIDPNECILDWESFVHRKNLLTYCKEIIKTDIPVACMIWARHLATILPDFEIKNMIKLLNAIPPTVEPFQIIQWLKHFVPSILQCYPHLMSQLVEWSIQKTRGLQYSAMWPEIGLEFGNKVLQIFTDVHFLLVDVRRQYETNIDKVHSLIIALEDLSVLKRDYNLSITLDDYLKEKIEDTALNLLKRVQLTNLGRMVNNFLYPIFMEKGLSPEPSIIRYIKFLCTNKVISCWQDRAVECVELVNDEEAKLQCVLLILKSAPVPLSAVLNPLLKYGTVSHPLATQIFVEYKSQIIKIIKGKYGWPADYNLNYNDDHMKLMFRIMKLNLPEMLDDIRTLIQTTSNIDDRANFYCVYELAKRGRVERAVQVLDSLDTATRVRCCEAAMTIIMEILNESGACEGLENLVELVQVMETRMQGQWVNHSVEQLVRLKVLRTNFKLDVDFFGLGNVNTRQVYLEAGIEFIIDGLHLKESDAYMDGVWWDIQMLCKALELDVTVGLYKFVHKIGNLHMTCAVVKILVTTCKVDRNNCEMCLKFVYLMLVQQMMFTSE